MKSSLFAGLWAQFQRWLNLDSAVNKPDSQPTQVQQQETEETLAIEANPVPYDENLLERARTQWQFGDWESLAKIERDTLQHHPDRAKLALLAAAGRLQTGYPRAAQHYIHLARGWGCSETLIRKILIAGVHNSLGKAAVALGKEQKALEHFTQAITLGAPGADSRLLIQARIQEQKRQLQQQSPVSATPLEAPYSEQSTHEQPA